ncbi:MAG: universal stress protein [Desulfobacteraceae bacterium]|nr:MAG: universal stress protein [Desulfobacteraceae bacterium]
MIQTEHVNIKKILYATDLSENARYVFRYAVSLSEKYSASITMLHVVHEVPVLADRSVAGYINAERWEQIKKHHLEDARQALIGKRKEHLAVKEVLDQFAENARNAEGASRFNLDEVIVEVGNPVEVILEVAESRNCDIIVMGKTGQGLIEGALMGSTATRVVRRSKKPVLVIRNPD